MVKAFLYDAEGRDREVNAGKATLAAAGDHQLLWFDLRRDASGQIDAMAKLTGIAVEARNAIAAAAGDTALHTYETHFQFSVPAPPQGLRRSTERLDFLIAPTWLATVRDSDIKFLAAFRDQDRGETMKGRLTPAVLAASLLDWHLESFFDAIAKVEAALDALDAKVLASRANDGVLGELAKMRRQVAVLRASIAEQRPLFHGLVRPDFAPVADSPDAHASYTALSGRFDRTVDSVERAREAVVGSFDLFASKTGQETNELVKGLTFVTVIIGLSAAVAGIFGMNFKVPIFETGPTGFYGVLGGLVALIIVSAVLARWRRWI